ncbi:MAG: hypothetical protein ACRDTH_27910 [Pseudonocardiaceae bacterium]
MSRDDPTDRGGITSLARHAAGHPAPARLTLRPAADPACLLAIELRPPEVEPGQTLASALILLMWITLIPFPTALVAEHLRDGGEATKTTVAVFSGTLFLTSIGFTALYAWITHDDRLVHSLPPRRAVVAAHIRFGMGLAAYGLVVGLAFVVPYAALAIHALSAGYYAFDQATVDASERAGT